jgi:predicted TIM-barrel enzyme
MKVLPVIHILHEKQAIEQAALAMNAGADGFWLINHAGDDDLTLSLAVNLEKRHRDGMVGVNLLSLSANETLDAVVANGLQSVWLDYAGIHSSVSDLALLQRQQELVKTHDMKIFAGTAFKYQRPEPDPVKAAALAHAHGLVVTTSGSGTGHAAEVSKIKVMSDAIQRGIAVASGLTLENVGEFHPYVKYALVATGIALDTHYFCPQKLTDFVLKVKHLNASQHPVFDVQQTPIYGC